MVAGASRRLTHTLQRLLGSTMRSEWCCSISLCAVPTLLTAAASVKCDVSAQMCKPCLCMRRVYRVAVAARDYLRELEASTPPTQTQVCLVVH
jgi:hypothetical protein